MISRHVYLVLLLAFIIVSGCATDVKINPRACRTRAEWLILPEEQFKYKDMFEPYHPKDTIEDKHFIKKITLMAPFSFFTPQEFMLRDILEEAGLTCDQIRSVGLTFKESFWDVLLNFIPPLSRITLVIEGDLRGLESEDSFKESASPSSSAPEDEDDQFEDERDFDLE
ncbi:MAG: hypothetical protein HYV97_08735 [Bdellovibrio sp.]|nr:hypothetical protein [Bdellovibrio sp.]